MSMAAVLSRRRWRWPVRTAATGRLRAAPDRPAEASFFLLGRQLQKRRRQGAAGRVLRLRRRHADRHHPGLVHRRVPVGRERRIGGMNHFMLPDGAGDSGRYGSYAMELLINQLMKRGASRSTLEAKVFGGGAVIASMTSMNVGERNTQFVLDYLRTERIPVVSKDVLDVCARKVCLLPAQRQGAGRETRTDQCRCVGGAGTRAAAKAAPQATGGWLGRSVLRQQINMDAKTRIRVVVSTTPRWCVGLLGEIINRQSDMQCVGVAADRWPHAS